MTARRRLLGQVHTAKKALALDERTYRAVLERVTGHRSAAECTEHQLARAVTEFRRLGWRPRRPGERKGPADRRKSQLSKARALWRSLWCLDETDSDSDDALAAYAARMTRTKAQPDGIQRLQWLDAAGWAKVIRGLQGWCRRVGYETTDTDVARINACRVRLGLPRAARIHCAKIRLVEILMRRCRDASLEADVEARCALVAHGAKRDDPRPEHLSAEAADAAARAIREHCL